ncbi:metallophosphoesterase [Myxococcus sp. CA051A]|uniref:Metallophosphoesterase n=1 Tax=Myxococcus llanfairpwllgwyngyllgogerychwyrndrobwllllantysiliogogogochensis TaxID=2590453 RepID=A0A540WZK5_9BACT|nr:metallophosphoesterase [Myxococcus llanfairpwllgwyngyllgogerychwyrndrobwllllantysiliogogogochensis]NTX59786.1 metallophosphoesterase [Myxococcus sp. CA051A]TQF14431.1 metallophosphoesterase [Myxococcus llanfairpwllgwyngyllgogerychwyrndrobwllllantysiliogogogochensis]
MRSWVPCLLLLLCVSCDVFELHPYEIRGGVRDTNARALERLQRNVSGGSFRFAVLGDIGVYQDDSVDAVKDLARRDVDFVVQMGDLTEFSSAQEYDWVAGLLEDASVPALAVIGNHDLLGKGRELYLHRFGPTFLAFEHGGSRFVLFDSNSREYGFPGNVPDLEQLRSALGEAPGGGHLFTFSHVPPGHPDFDGSLTEPLEQLQAEHGVTVSFHGHTHRFSTDARRGVRYFIADSIELHSYLLVTVEGESVAVEQVFF